ncbi:MAG TPA: HD domain-containing protein, partial [Candidatus Lokiarchaeia archaeon]
MPTHKIIFDNVHGNIRLSQIQREIMDTEIFQRLRRISHLALADYVFPGATHNRFSHSIGTMYIITEMINSLIENKDGISIPKSDVEVISLVGLLHDVGHLPFSHVFEDIMEIETGKKHEDLTIKIIEESEIGRIVERYPDIDLALLINILKKNFTPTDERTVNYVTLIDGNLDADKLDYLKRDSLHTGVGYGSIDVERILKTISIDDNGLLCIMNKGRLALENLCIARFHMFQTVYLHKSVVAFEKMLNKIYEKMMHDEKDSIMDFKTVLELDESGLIRYNDNYIWHKILNYSGNDSFIKELIKMLLRHESIKLVIDDPKLVEPNENPERKLTLLKYDPYQKLIHEKIPDFDMNWLFTADSRTKFRKSDYYNDPIKVEIEEDGKLKYTDISDLKYSIMNP